jgi:hypothetical protein
MLDSVAMPAPYGFIKLGRKIETLGRTALPCIFGICLATNGITIAAKSAPVTYRLSTIAPQPALTGRDNRRSIASCRRWRQTREGLDDAASAERAA